MDSVNKALSIAMTAHRGQLDKGGNDYIKHPIYVASLVDTEQEKIVALLHDVVEDTDVTLDDLERQGLSSEVVFAIDCITKRVGEKYSDYLKRICKSTLAIKVKIADMTHNADISRISNPTQKDIDRTNTYIERIKHLKSIIN